GSSTGHGGRSRLPDFRSPARGAVHCRRRRARAGNRSGAPGRPAVRGGGGVPRHEPGRTARSQRAGPQPPHRGPGRARPGGPQAGSRRRPGAAGCPHAPRSGQTPEHRGAADGSPAGLPAGLERGGRRQHGENPPQAHRITQEISPGNGGRHYHHLL
ncbi:transcriptional regulator, HxlR family, partial [Arthrobacter sp. DR-2P]